MTLPVAHSRMAGAAAKHADASSTSNEVSKQTTSKSKMSCMLGLQRGREVHNPFMPTRSTETEPDCVSKGLLVPARNRHP